LDSLSPSPFLIPTLRNHLPANLGNPAHPNTKQVSSEYCDVLGWELSGGPEGPCPCDHGEDCYSLLY
jgi:hypothetical protein